MTFKAAVFDSVELTMDVASEFGDGVIPKGARGTIVERYEQPTEGYAVDVAIPDESLAGGLRYENVVLLPHQFAVVGSDEPDGQQVIGLSEA